MNVRSDGLDDTSSRTDVDIASVMPSEMEHCRCFQEYLFCSIAYEQQFFCVAPCRTDRSESNLHNCGRLDALFHICPLTSGERALFVSGLCQVYSAD